MILITGGLGFVGLHTTRALVDLGEPCVLVQRSPAYAGDGLDMCYVKDCVRALALLQLAPQLGYRTYNIASGRVLTNREIAAAVKRIVPDARIELPEGQNPAGPGQEICLDISRLREDTGYQPAYDTESAVADYLTWLRDGHER